MVTPRSIHEVAMLQRPHAAPVLGLGAAQGPLSMSVPFFLPIFAGLLGVSPHPIFRFYYYSVAQSG